MNLRISGIHMDIGEAFRTRISDRIGESLEKYFDGGSSGRVTIEKASGRYSADCFVHLDSGVELQAEGQGQDPQSAFEAAAERFEKRLRRYKRKLKSHPGPGTDPLTTAQSETSTQIVVDEEDEEHLAFGPDAAVVAESPGELTSMSVAEAVIALDTGNTPVLLFRNAANERVNIVYRRPDGHVGWIDPAAPVET